VCVCVSCGVFVCVGVGVCVCVSVCVYCVVCLCVWVWVCVWCVCVCSVCVCCVCVVCVCLGVCVWCVCVCGVCVCVCCEDCCLLGDPYDEDSHSPPQIQCTFIALLDVISQEAEMIIKKMLVLCLKTSSFVLLYEFASSDPVSHRLNIWPCYRYRNW